MDKPYTAQAEYKKQNAYTDQEINSKIKIKPYRQKTHLTMKSILPIIGVVWTLIALAHGKACTDYASYAGQQVCDQYGGQCGQCVSFVKICTSDYRKTSQWKRGLKVRETSSIPVGTAIATFPNGRYSGHAAIYTGQNDQGIQVWDQWSRRNVTPRTIRWNGSGISNNGDLFYVIN
ncbi:unnamed protein product [Didymodactylos carnosus]|uniref:Uncharacterized protein n=1 Tax=Didymodactylos carnosus TaxID=1234261 RepID=A0A814VQ26_9BILA|nr:unnamed protein product [Didymodactylos carnosus]CAF3957953.1 unnamed protein product [Didymodactylos carnosus]